MPTTKKQALVRKKIEAGVLAADEGKVMRHEDVKKRILHR